MKTLARARAKNAPPRNECQVAKMLSFQIFTGLRAIGPLQINGAIGNERVAAVRGPRQSRCFFLVPQIPTSSCPAAIFAANALSRLAHVRVSLRARARIHVHTRYYQCLCEPAADDVAGRRRSRRSLPRLPRIKPQKYFAAALPAAA